MPTWLIVLLVVLVAPVLFYTYVYVEMKLRARHNNKIIKKINEDLFG